jgi:hypothetical protein
MNWEMDIGIIDRISQLIRLIITKQDGVLGSFLPTDKFDRSGCGLQYLAITLYKTNRSAKVRAIRQ